MATWPGRKTRPKTRPYEVWEGVGPFTGWTWNVLKKNQKDDTQPYATAFVLCTSPMTGTMGDMGDEYCDTYRTRARMVRSDYND